MNFLSGTTNNSTATSSPVGAQSRNMFDDYKPVFEDFRDYDNDDDHDLMMILNYIHPNSSDSSDSYQDSTTAFSIPRDGSLSPVKVENASVPDQVVVSSPDSRSKESPPKIKRKSRKRKLSLDITCSGSIPKEVHSSIELASKYANYYAHAVNDDSMTFPERLLAVCSPQLEAELSICHLIQNNQEKNVFGKFHRVSLSFEQFVALMRSIQLLSPDSVIKIISCNACQIGDEYAYMAIFHFVGTVFCKDNILLTADQDGQSIQMITAEEKLMKQENAQRQLHDYQAVGSLTLRRKRNEKIHRLEFFYEYVN